MLGVASEDEPEQPYREVTPEEIVAIQEGLIGQLQEKLHEQQQG